MIAPVPWWTPPRRSLLRWFHVAPACSKPSSAAASASANAWKTARTVSVPVPVTVPMLAVMSAPCLLLCRLPVRNRRQAEPPRAIDCSVDLGAGAQQGPGHQAVPHREHRQAGPCRDTALAVDVHRVRMDG